ncbi:MULTISPECIES: sugar kinase [unclassified Microbacterium]|uniref:sugar kinase n=1 Tax=unclassified Microbacterium TaxID=2609290 RepID=UPI000EA90456|nr:MULTISPECIES: sugar kinase [unclassified Microbacterium]MBT2486912.1 sugar kinase [Microbacterium sp. ISL-108]RKN64827.1 sugar kinase [Microbacterium sp. CGR2]
MSIPRTSVSPPPAVVCVGESMALITPTGSRLDAADSATIGHAGAEANVAVGLASAGHRAVWASRLGDDPLGVRIAAELERRHVELWIERDPDAPTGVMFKDPGVESSDVYYYRRGSAASLMTAGFVPATALDGVRIVHTTGITPALSASCRAMVDQLYADARTAGALVSFDVNDRRALWSLEDAASTLQRLADAADIAFVGRDEAERIWGTATPDEIRAHVPNCALLVVKDGDIGATAYAGDSEPVFVAAPRVDVVEPVGAGDAFASGFLAATLDGQALADRLAAGHSAAARVLTTHGDMPPIA